MNSKIYYKVGSYIVGLVCCSLILLIAFRLEKGPDVADHSKLTMIQELRLYRQLLTDVKTTNNPNVSESLKDMCAHDLDDVNAMIDAYEETGSDELSVRVRIEQLTQRLLADPFISSDGRNRTLVNAKLDI